jgi:pimeloyl-ACP methyl ester carboxylesterase
MRHALTRNSRDFHRFAQRLTAEGRRVVTLDYRGRGQSDRDANTANYNIVREAQDVVLVLEALGIEKAMFVGTSRGGLILHILAGMAAAGRIAAIVLNDIGPVIEADGLMRIRDYLSLRGTFSTVAEAAAHLERVHGAEFPLFKSIDWQDMAEAIYRNDNGTLVGDYDAAIVEPLKTMDFSQSLADLWAQYQAMTALPLLVVRGENSRLLSSATVTEMLARHPKAQAITASGQGHAPNLHDDTIFRTIADFLASS